MSSLSWIWKNSNNIFFHCFNTISFDIWKFWIWLLIGWFRWKCLRLIYPIKFIFKWFQKVSFDSCSDTSGRIFKNFHRTWVRPLQNRYVGHFCPFDATTLKNMEQLYKYRLIKLGQNCTKIQIVRVNSHDTEN